MMVDSPFDGSSPKVGQKDKLFGVMRCGRELRQLGQALLGQAVEVDDAAEHDGRLHLIGVRT